MTTLRKDSPLPLYEQLKAALGEALQSGKWRKGDVFLSLSEISERYAVSQITARRAVADLVADGRLTSGRGRRPEVANLVGKADGLSGPPAQIGALFDKTRPDSEDIRYQDMPWTSVIFSGVQEQLAAAGFLVTLIPVGDDATQSVAALEKTVGSFAGFICLSADVAAKFHALFERREKPYVMINPYSEKVVFNYVTSDYYGGSAKIADYFVDRGLRSFLYLTTPPSVHGVPEKMRGFQETLMRRGIHPTRIHIRYAEALAKEAGRRAFLDFMAEPGAKPLLPLGVFSTGDWLSLGAAVAAKELGLRVPLDVSVAGSTGLAEAKLADPPLTTVECPMPEVGRAAAAMLVKMVRSGRRQIPGVKMKMTFAERKSVL